MKFEELDPLLHNQLRLAVMSLLMTVESAEFNWLLEQTQSTPGNLSVQLSKLQAADYITVIKSFRDKKPLTTCEVTRNGILAFESYVQKLESYLKPKKSSS
jgi:DNA-binding MarR family transcriptional regulator